MLVRILVRMLENMEEQPQIFRKIIPSLILIMIVVMFSSLGRTILSPLLPQVEQAFQLSHGPSSRLFLYMSIGFSGSILFSGYFSALLSHRGTILFSSLLLSAALLLTAFAPQLVWIKVGVILIGMGSGLYPASGLTVLNSIVVREDRQKAISVHEVGPHLAMLLAPLMANFFILFANWRAAYAVLSFLTILAGIFFFVRIRSGFSRGNTPSFKKLFLLLKNPSFLLIMLFFTLGISSLQGIYSVVPVFLVSEGVLSQSSTNFLFSMSRIIPIMALLFSGSLQDRIGSKRSLQYSLLGSGLLILLMGLLKGTPLLFAVFLQPALGAVLLTAALGAASEIGPPEHINLTFSMLLPTAALVGTGIVPSFIGFMGDKASFSLAFFLFGILMLASCFLTKYIPKVFH